MSDSNNSFPQKMRKFYSNKGLLLLFFGLVLVSCNTDQKRTSSETRELQNGNLFLPLSTENLSDFRWLNEPGSFTLENSTLTVVAEKGTDFFNNPEDEKKTATAPILFQEIQGDFIARALVRPDFSSVWNAVAIMVHMDNSNWIKFAFENSDATGQSIVTVVTKEVSDDANGVTLSGKDEIWLKLIRKGNIYSMLWSLDDNDYKMARLTAMPPADSVKIGIEAQCPVGPSATHKILYFGLENITVEDLRKGE